MRYIPPTLLSKDEITYIRNSIDSFKTNKELAEKFNLSEKQIRYILYKNKIRRSYSNLRKTKVKNIFNKYTSKSCYWAGFILADGCISNRKNNGKETSAKFLTINIKKSDEDHLIHFLHDLESENIRILYRNAKCNNKIFPYVSVILYKNDICESLYTSFNIYKNKFSDINFLEKIPTKYKIDFIRGVFDADGTASVGSDRGSLRLTVSLCGSKFILKSISDFMNLPCYIVHRKKDLYVLAYNQYNSIKFLKKLYKNTGYCLRRKKEKLNYFLNNMSNKQKFNLEKKLNLHA